MFFDSNKKQQAEQLKKHLVEQQNIYHAVFDTPEGKQVLEDLRKRCFDNRTTYPGKDDIGQWGINEGRRSIYKYIVGLLERDIQDLMGELTKEAG